MFTSMADKHAPLKRLRVKKNRTNPGFSSDLKIPFLQKNQAWALARKTGKTADWLLFRQLRNILTGGEKRQNLGLFLVL
jgi:hypothetical protein